MYQSPYYAQYDRNTWHNYTSICCCSSKDKTLKSQCNEQYLVSLITGRRKLSPVARASIFVPIIGHSEPRLVGLAPVNEPWLRRGLAVVSIKSFLAQKTTVVCCLHFISVQTRLGLMLPNFGSQARTNVLSMDGRQLNSYITTSGQKLYLTWARQRFGEACLLKHLYFWGFTTPKTGISTSCRVLFATENWNQKNNYGTMSAEMGIAEVSFMF